MIQVVNQMVVLTWIRSDISNVRELSIKIKESGFDYQSGQYSRTRELTI